MEWKLYTAKPIKVTTSGAVKKADHINGFTAVNKGGQLAYINGFPIDPPTALTSGEAIEFNGNENELYDDMINVQFAGAGTNPLVYITQKVYKNICP